MDISNTQVVGSQGDTITVALPWRRMTRTQALVHAAWLVSVADPVGDDFAEVLAKVQSS